MSQDAHTIVDEMEAILAWLRAEFPEIPTDQFGLQEIPEKPPVDSFYLRFQNDNREHVTSNSIVTRREYQVIHFNALPGVRPQKGVDLLSRMDALSRKLIFGRMVIPINEESRRYIRIDSFSFGNVLDTEDTGTLKAVIGVLNVESRSARDAQSYEKIRQIYARYVIRTEFTRGG